jgi:SOS-response transcriptional repressor LexA
MHGLNRTSGAARNCSRSAEVAKNLSDYVHGGIIIRCSDIWQAQINPKCALPEEIPSWQTIRMEEKAFEPELVRAKMKERGVSQAALSKLMGLTSQSAFSNILKGKRRVTADEAAIVYRFLGIEREPNFRIVPVIGITSAGRWREAIEMPVGKMPIPRNIAGERAFGLEVCGDSMDRLIDDGGWVLIDPDRKELRPGSCYLIANGGGEATVKMYERNPARFEPCSNNPEHVGFEMSDADFTVIGKVVWRGGAMP